MSMTRSGSGSKRTSTTLPVLASSIKTARSVVERGGARKASASSSLMVSSSSAISSSPSIAADQSSVFGTATLNKENMPSQGQSDGGPSSIPESKTKVSKGKEPALVQSDQDRLYFTEEGIPPAMVQFHQKMTSLSQSAHLQRPIPPRFDPKANAALARDFPDPFEWCQDSSDSAFPHRIDLINAKCPLLLLNGGSIRDQAAIVGMSLSHDGSMLLTLCSVGSAYIWDLETFQPIQCLRDRGESNIDEFYVGRFTPDDSGVIVGGKLKDRRRWSEADHDNQVLPCPLKIFDTLSSKVLAQLDGHEEEILCIKRVCYKGENYYVSSSQDGYIHRWQVDETWKTLIEGRRFLDGLTCMAFTISFLPNTGCRYFLAACDDSIKLYDLETLHIIQTFGSQYSFYCDCAKFINPLQGVFRQLVGENDHPSSSKPKPFQKPNVEVDEEEIDELASDSEEDSDLLESTGFAFLISRGVEVLDAEENTVNSTPNRVTLHKLIYPTRAGDPFKLEVVRKYQHEEYQSNSWLIKIASNGRYVAAPSYDGRVFIYNLVNGQVSAVLKDHDEIEVRDVLFHPTRPLLFTCADDGSVKVYGRGNNSES